MWLILEFGLYANDSTARHIQHYLLARDITRIDLRQGVGP